MEVGKPQDSLLLSELESLLGRIQSITIKERDAAIALVKSKYSCSKGSRYGGCLSCGRRMDYLSAGQTMLHSSHVREGDKWLEVVKSNWRVPESVWSPGQHLYINGYRHKVQQYICDTCNQRINSVVTSVLCGCTPDGSVLESVYKVGWNNNDWRQAVRILRGRKATLSEVKRLLPKAVEVLTQDYLRKLDYEKFLQTSYWATLKDVVFNDRGGKCERCGADDYLHLHHISYEHRGNEINHMEDLELLCSNCHADHHNKPRK